MVPKVCTLKKKASSKLPSRALEMEPGARVKASANAAFKTTNAALTRAKKRHQDHRKTEW